MMSAPDKVDVVNPGSNGRRTIGSSDSSNSVDSTQPRTAIASPWFVGSTSTLLSSTAMPRSPPVYPQDPRTSTPSTTPTHANHGVPLLDQAGVRRATPSPPPPTMLAAIQRNNSLQRSRTVPSNTPTSPTGTTGATIGQSGEATSTGGGGVVINAAMTRGRSLHQDRLLDQPSPAVDSVLTASCDAMGFDIAEIWLRTGPKTHQLTHSHLRPTALEESVRNEIFDVYYGERSSERTHRLSPALCKRAKDCADVVWVTAQTASGAEALRQSISDVRTAVAIPVSHETSNTNMTVIFFSTRRIIMRPQAVEFLVHMALAAGVASINTLSDPITMLDDVSTNDNNHVSSSFLDQAAHHVQASSPHPYHHRSVGASGVGIAASGGAALAQSEHIPSSASMLRPTMTQQRVSVTGARLDLQWRQLRNVEYLTDGGNSWIHTAMLDGKPVVVKTLKPECQDIAVAMTEIESELAVHSRLHHENIVELVGAGMTSRGVRFVVLERLDGGTLTQMLGYDTRIRDRRRRFWRKKQFSYLDVLKCARSMATAMMYLHEKAIPGSLVMHRDLKPDNIGFQLNGKLKLLDFGLAKVIDNTSITQNESYELSGETGSLRYMAPEVAESLPYNHKADVYSFGIILWELNTCKKPFDGLTRELFYERIVHGGERPPLQNKRWPEELKSLMSDCWNSNYHQRPNFSEIIQRLDVLLKKEKGGIVRGGLTTKKSSRKLGGMIDRHSTWF